MENWDTIQALKAQMGGVLARSQGYRQVPEIGHTNYSEYYYYIKDFYHT